MGSEIRILIVEDNPVDAELAEYTLRSAGMKFVSKVVETEEGYRAALNDFSPDLIISDYDLPRFNGADALSIVKERRPDLPFILYTGALGEERAIDILTGGATDYVMKNRLSRLVPAVERALKEWQEQKKRKAAEAERDLLFQQLEDRVQERTAELQAEIEVRKQIEDRLQNYISEMKLMGQTIREREVRYSALFESADDAIILTDPSGEGRIISVNPAACRQFGYTEQEFQNFQQPRAAIVDTTDPRFGIFMEQRNAKGHSKSELTYKRKDGSTFLGEISSSYFSENGKRLAVAIIRDVTERKQAEEALIASRNELQSIIDGTTSIIYVFDLEEKFLIANKALGELLGSTPEKIIGKRRHDFMPRETAECHEANDRKVIEQGHALEFEEYGPVGKDGRLITWLTTKFPLRDSQGKIYAVAGFSADITERKEARDELELRVNERTAALVKSNESLVDEIEKGKQTQRRLQSARDKLRAMAAEIVMVDERSRQQFATDLHDTVVQTMGAAKLRAQLIQNDIPKEAKPLFTEMQDMLSQSIVQARSIMAEMSPPVLYEIGFVPALEWLTEQISDQHKISIGFNADSNPILKHEIQVLLFQATRELLMNIVKHSGAANASVKVSANGRIIKIEVADNGKGYNAKQTSTDITHGGFGLFSIRERLRYFDGNMSIRSKPGLGTKVTMTVPLITE